MSNTVDQKHTGPHNGAAATVGHMTHTVGHMSHTHACMHTCTNACTLTCMQKHLQTHMHACKHAQMQWARSTVGPYLSLVPYYGILSRITGISVNRPVKAPYYGNFGKTVPKMLQIRSFCGILQFPPRKCPEFYFFPVKFPYFTIFVGVFVKFYYFFPRKSPEFYFFPRKSPVFHYFC